MSIPSSSALRDLEPALDELPVFPLPQVALFPGSLMPLHIFEPRYRAMMRDVINSHKALAIAQLVVGQRRTPDEPPIFERIAGAGVLVDYTELPSGRFNVLVRGRARVELEELPFVPPYRRARAKVLASVREAVAPGDIAALISSATSFASVVRARDHNFEFRLPPDGDAGTLADHCAAHLLIDGRDRQKVLEETSVIERVRLVTETLSLQRLAVHGGSGAPN